MYNPRSLRGDGSVKKLVVFDLVGTLAASK
jgi:hypothetical protein